MCERKKETCDGDKTIRSKTTVTADEPTWLYPYLANAGFPAHVIADCEQNLVQKHAIYSHKIFTLIPREKMNNAYFDQMGVRQVGVQQVLFDMHGWAKTEEIFMNIGLFLVSLFAFAFVCSACCPESKRKL